MDVTDGCEHTSVFIYWPRFSEMPRSMKSEVVTTYWTGQFNTSVCVRRTESETTSTGVWETWKRMSCSSVTTLKPSTSRDPRYELAGTMCHCCSTSIHCNFFHWQQRKIYPLFLFNQQVLAAYHFTALSFLSLVLPFCRLSFHRSG